jgi:hypothetical protein
MIGTLIIDIVDGETVELRAPGIPTLDFIMPTSDASIALTGISGPKGDRGLQGDRGPQGEKATVATLA